MSTCGMYDNAGEWLYNVGLPAKSGVAGGVLAVLPGQLGIGVFSPPLDDQGNSVRGVKVCERLSHELQLHLLGRSSGVRSVVRRTLRGDEIGSNRVRTMSQEDAIAARRRAIGLFELQGDLFFATAEKVHRAVVADLEGLEFVVVDFTHVSSFDEPSVAVLNSSRRSSRSRAARSWRCAKQDDGIGLEADAGRDELRRRRCRARVVRGPTLRPGGCLRAAADRTPSSSGSTCSTAWVDAELTAVERAMRDAHGRGRNRRDPRGSRRRRVVLPARRAHQRASPARGGAAAAAAAGSPRSAPASRSARWRCSTRPRARPTSCATNARRSCHSRSTRWSSSTGVPGDRDHDPFEPGAPVGSSAAFGERTDPRRPLSCSTPDARGSDPLGRVEDPVLGLELREDVFDVVRPLRRRRSGPFAAGGREEVAAVDVDGARERRRRIVHRVHGVVTEQADVARMQRASAGLDQTLARRDERTRCPRRRCRRRSRPTCGDRARRASCPAPTRPSGSSGRHSRGSGVIPGAIGRESGGDVRRLRHGPVEHRLDRDTWLGLAVRGDAVGDQLVDVEHGPSVAEKRRARSACRDPVPSGRAFVMVCAWPRPRKKPTVAIIGAGAGGLAMGVKLKRAGYDFTIFEKSDGVGGTWRAQHLSGRGVRRPVAPLLVLVRAEPVVDAHVRDAAGDPRLSRAVHRPIRIAAAPAHRGRDQRGALGRRRRSSGSCWPRPARNSPRRSS